MCWHVTDDDPAAAPELGEGREVDHDWLVVVHQSVHDIRSEFHNLDKETFYNMQESIGKKR